MFNHISVKFHLEFSESYLLSGSSSLLRSCYPINSVFLVQWNNVTFKDITTPYNPLILVLSLSSTNHILFHVNFLLFIFFILVLPLTDVSYLLHDFTVSFLFFARETGKDCTVLQETGKPSQKLQ